MAKVRPIEWFDFRKYHRLLIDTNVWLYLNGPQVRDDDKSRKYSDALKRIRRAESHVLTDVLVLSEFINRYLRIKYKVWKRRKEVEFKGFRSSTDYPAVAKDTANAVRVILKVCRPVDTALESIDMEALLIDFEKNRRDFNDQVLAETCRSQDLTLITHDGDFRGYEITVLTANNRLLEPGDGSSTDAPPES